MDDLDRLYFELVEAQRRRGPDALHAPVTISELHEEIIPYRRVRNRVGFRSNDEYETAFSRLVAGERGYLMGDPVVQDDLRQTLADVLPDIRRHRKHGEARLSLNPETIPPPGDIRYAPPAVRDRGDWNRVVVPEPEGAEGEEAGRDGPAAAATPEAHSQAGSSSEEQGAGGPAHDAAQADSSAEPDEVPAEAEAQGECPACGERPPPDAAFCPFCGRRLRAQSCGGCGAPLEDEWRFCPECGTGRTDGSQLA